DLVRGAGEVAVDAHADRGVRPRIPAPRVEEVAGQRVTASLVEGRVDGLVLGQGTRANQCGALTACRQPRARRQGIEMVWWCCVDERGGGGRRRGGGPNHPRELGGTRPAASSH